MFDFDEITKRITEQQNKISEMMDTLDIKGKKEKLEELEKMTANPDFWNDTEKSSQVSAEISDLKNQISKFDSTNNSINITAEMLDLLKENEDDEIEKELIKEINQNEKDLSQLEINTLFNNKYDKNNAIVTIHPGAGGTEAMDWAEMLYRMYTRWAEENNFKLEELDYLAGDEAGVKSVTFLVSGKYAYGYLKSEHGVHRLVRISPFDAGARRHTSFASVEVLPEINDDEKIDIRPEDIKMDVFRSSGAGGQHINKTSSAVRLTHIPTGIVVSCQTQRSQFQNRDTAMKMLVSKLVNLKEREHKEKIEDLKGVQMKIEWGSQIRSYVFCPYTMVKDHRTNYETGNVQKVMDGDLNDFIYAYLKMNVKSSG